MSSAASSPKSITSSERSAPRRLPWLLGLTAGLIILIGGWYAYRNWFSPPPSLPLIDLQGADVDVVELVDKARQRVSAQPRSAEAWGQLAMALHANGLGDVADQVYAAAQQLEPGNWHWPYLRGYLLYHGPGGPEKAWPILELAAERSPPDSLARLRLADALLDVGNLEGAEKNYLRVLRKNRNEPWARLGLGKVAILREQFRESLELILPVAHESSGIQQRATTVLVHVYERLGESAAARAEQERLESLPPDPLPRNDPMLAVFELQVGIGNLLKQAQEYANQNRTADMLSVLRKAVEKYPDSEVAWTSLGTTLVATGDLASAEQALRRCVELTPRTANCRLELGKVLLAQKRYSDAEEMLRSSLKINPRDAEAHYFLGDCQLAQGDRTAAKESFESALRFSPANETVRRRLQELQKSDGPK